MTDRIIEAANRYAYAIETVDEHDSQWWQLGDGGPDGGVENSHDCAEAFAQAVLVRFLDHVRDHQNDYNEMFLRRDPCAGQRLVRQQGDQQLVSAPAGGLLAGGLLARSQSSADRAGCG